MAALSTAARNAAADAIAALVDAGAGAGKLKLGTASMSTLLAELTMSATAFAAAVAGVLTANSITQDSSADASGTAVEFILEDSNGNLVISGSVGTSGTDVVMVSNIITATEPVSITAMTLTMPA